MKIDPSLTPKLPNRTITGYALLGRVIKVILEEPKRYDQRETRGTRCSPRSSPKRC